MPQPMHVRTIQQFPFRAMRRAGLDPVVEAARDTRPPTPISKIVRDPKRDRLNGSKGTAARMGNLLAKRLFGY